MKKTFKSFSTYLFKIEGRFGGWVIRWCFGNTGPCKRLISICFVVDAFPVNAQKMVAYKIKWLRQICETIYTKCSITIIMFIDGCDKYSQYHTSRTHCSFSFTVPIYNFGLRDVLMYEINNILPAFFHYKHL